MRRSGTGIASLAEQRSATERRCSNAIPLSNARYGRTPLAPEGNGYWSADAPAATAGSAYKLVINGDTWKIDPYARQTTSSVGDGIVVAPLAKPAPFVVPNWNELVIYELHAATFPDHPSTREGMLKAVTDDLWYLKELGVNAIEVLPTAEFSTDVSWGYNPSDIFSVEAAYGGPERLKALVEAAHAQGIAVILDVVYNHFGPNDLSLWQFDGWHESWNGKDTGGIYFYDKGREHTPWGDTRPDYGRPEVRQYIRDNVMMWLEEFGVDGLRFDAIAYIRNVDGNDDDPGGDLADGWRLLQRLNDEKDARQPGKITIAEDMKNNPWITKRTGEGGAGFNAQWDARFHHALVDVLVKSRDEDRDLGAIRDIVSASFNGDAFQRVLYTDSHDEDAAKNGKCRLTAAIQPDQPDGWFAKKRSTLGAAAVLTAPGIPMIMQGQELLERRPFGDTSDYGVEWDNFCSRKSGILGTCRSSCQTCEPNGVFRGIHLLYRDLIRLRRDWFDTTRGLRGQHVNVFHVNDDRKVIAYHRWADGGSRDDVVVLLNFGISSYDAYTIGLPRQGLWRVRFNSDASCYDPSFGNHPSFDAAAQLEGRDGMPFRGSFGLGPYSAVILSQDV